MKGRMPWASWLSFLLLCLAVGEGFLFAIRPVQADPHAVFYTAIGQRQLFFNFLAALDQADYVEPATGTFSRDTLQQKRNAALEAEALAEGRTVSLVEDSVSAATKTNLSGVVVRPITLEGNDLFTQMTAKDRAVETKRRAGIADLLTRVFCPQALGRDNCSDSLDALARRSQAYVTDPLKWWSAPYLDGFVANLLSGTPQHSQRQKEIKKSDQFEPGYLYSKPIGNLYKNSSGEARDEVTQATLRTALSVLPLAPHPDTFEDVTFDANGNAKLAFEPPRRGTANTALAAESSDEYVARYRDKVRQHLYFTQALKATAAQGAATIGEFQDTIEAEGEVADVKLKAKADPVCTGTSCKPPEDAKDIALVPAIEVPVAGKIAQVRTITDALAQANTSLHDASVQALERPEGSETLIEGKGDSKVSGLTTGTVAGTISNSKTRFSGVARAVNERFPHAEQELGHVVEVFRPGRYTTTRCDCDVDKAANTFGAQIIAAINKYSL